MVGLIRRVLRLILVLFLVSLATFTLMQFAPGDPAVAALGEDATPENVATLRDQLGLDRPFMVRYSEWITDAMQGDLGTSLVLPRLPVSDRIMAAIPVTTQLAVMGVVMALLIAVPVAAIAAYRENGLFDRASSAISYGLLSVPSFVKALTLALIFTLTFDIFPRAQWSRLTADDGLSSNLHHAFLPALTLALALSAQYITILREDMLQTLRENYIDFARSKGLSTRYIMIRHALRPSLFSLVTLSTINLGHLLGGTVIVEAIFGLPGLGSLVVGAVNANDVPLVQGIVLVIAVIFVVLNSLVDLVYFALDPRTRHVTP